MEYKIVTTPAGTKAIEYTKYSSDFHERMMLFMTDFNTKSRAYKVLNSVGAFFASGHGKIEAKVEDRFLMIEFLKEGADPNVFINFVNENLPISSPEYYEYILANNSRKDAINIIERSVIAQAAQRHHSEGMDHRRSKKLIRKIYGYGFV